LLKVEGLGEAGVAALKIVHAAAQRLGQAEVMHRPVLGNWDKLMAYLHAVLARERVEQFRLLFLDNKNRLLADEAQARGTVNHTPVYPREVVKRALEIKAAAGPLGILLHDHIIVGNGAWLSFRKEGLL
jgi:DNA repair protein RadC